MGSKRRRKSIEADMLQSGCTSMDQGVYMIPSSSIRFEREDNCIVTSFYYIQSACLRGTCGEDPNPQETMSVRLFQTKWFCSPIKQGLRMCYPFGCRKFVSN